MGRTGPQGAAVLYDCFWRVSVVAPDVVFVV